MNRMKNRSFRFGFSIKRDVLFVVSVLLVVLVSGCGGGAPNPSASWVEREVPDAVAIAVPDGWVLLDREEVNDPRSLVIASSHHLPPVEGVQIHNSPPDVEDAHGPDNDMEFQRDQMVSSLLKTDYASSVRALEPRMIGGTQAWGYSAMITYRDGSIVPTQNWMLWREDGHWSIDVKGFANTSVIPAELIGALDTISFIRPSSTPAAPYTVTTVSPSPGPSPSTTES